MSADADDLFERASQALDRDIPTIEEVTAKLAAALDELERQFPNGDPGPNAQPRMGLRYMTLLGRVRHSRWQLENGQCVEYPRGRRSRLDASESDEWETFLGAHPELTGDEKKEPPPPPAKPLAFTDAQVLRALRTAKRFWEAEFPNRRREGVSSSWIADELAGSRWVRNGGYPVDKPRPSRSDVIRVGQALARLAKAGRVCPARTDAGSRATGLL